MRRATLSEERGSLLIEVLIAIALFLAISTIIAQSLFAGFSGGKASQEKSAITGIASEELSMVRALADEHWDNVGSLRNDTVYHVESSSSSFAIVEGKQTGTIDGFPYSLGIRVKDVAREIATSTTAFSLDPQIAPRDDKGTLLVTCTVEGTGIQSIEISTVLTRWRNVVCGQGSWMSSSSLQAVPCATGNINLGAKSNIETGGQLRLCVGC